MFGLTFYGKRQLISFLRKDLDESKGIKRLPVQSFVDAFWNKECVR